jgi:hypothetical protein
MDWVLNHIFVLFIIAGAVASMVQKAKKAGAQQRPTPSQSPGALDPGAAERTRRVQEEIRRKIAERAGRLPAGPPPLPQSQAVGTSSAPPSRNIFQELARQMAEAKRNAEMQQRAQAAAAAQAQTRVEDERKSRELAEARSLAEAQRTLPRQQQTVATSVAYSGGTGQKTTAVSARDRLLANLREPDSLRRAWVLREILGEPVGLREGAF